MTGPNLLQSIAMSQRDQCLDKIRRHREHLSKTYDDTRQADLIRRAIMMQADILAVIRHHSGVGLLPSQYLRMTNATEPFA